MLDQWPAFQNLVPTLPTMQLNHWGSLSDYMQLPLEPQNASYYFFFTYTVVIPKIYEYIRMC